MASAGAAMLTASRRTSTRAKRAVAVLMHASPAPVMAEPSSCGVTAAGSTSATNRPRRITFSESDRPISSSRSAEISRTARPARRAARMCSQIAAWAPTSTPRVGWAAMRTFGSPLISRPTISFCWLPPESDAASTSMPGVRTSYSRTIRSVSLRAPARSIQTPLTLGFSVWWPSMRFSHSGRVEQHAVPVAVLGDVGDAGLAPGAGSTSVDMSVVAELDAARR